MQSGLALCMFSRTQRSSVSVEYVRENMLAAMKEMDLVVLGVEIDAVGLDELLHHRHVTSTGGQV